jgi:PAS domain S-box-containing protein
MTNRKKPDSSNPQWPRPTHDDERYTKIFQNASLGIAITDLQGRFEHCNPAYCHLLGYSLAELQALNFEALIHPDDRPSNWREVTRLVAGEVAAVDIENRYLHKDGSLLRVKKNVCVLHDEAGHPRQLLKLVTDLTKLETAQQRHQDTFYQLIKRNPFGIYVVDADFKLCEVSLGAERVFANVHPLIGRDFEEVLRQIWTDSFASEATTRFQHTLQTGESYTAPSTVQQRQDIHDVEAYDWRIERIVLPDGRFGVVCYFYDLTDRQRWEQQLRESEERFRSMADGLPLILWLHDSDGKLVFVNDTYCRFYDVKRHQMVNDRWQVLTHPDDGVAYAEEFARCVKDRSAFHGEVRVRRSDGQWRWMESWARPRWGAQGDYLGHIGVSADVTRRKDTEALLQEANSRKNHFLATLAHELRNPLAPIRNCVQILLHPAVSPADASCALQMIDRQSLAMVRLVEDLVDVSRITHGKLQLRREPVLLGPIVQHACDDARLLCDQAGLRLEVSISSEPMTVDADPVRLTQVFCNLLNNARKYTDRGGHLSLTVARDGQWVHVSVRDNGIGIAAEQLPHLFDMFEQGGADWARSQGGLGIGLALARHLVEAHGGTISAKSPGPGAGAEFTVVLPLSASVHCDAPAAHMAEVKRAVEHQILIVEDNPDVATSLSSLLQLNGMQVTVVSDGDAALRLFKQRSFNVVLLDLGLPQMSGFEVCQKLRALPRGKRTLMVAISGWGQDSDRQRSAAAGFDAHWVKPVDVQELMKFIFSQ